MMANPIEITFEIEPIIKVKCAAVDCRYNCFNLVLHKDRMAACNLKHITIGHNATCRNYEILPEMKEENEQVIT